MISYVQFDALLVHDLNVIFAIIFSSMKSYVPAHKCFS